MKVIWSKFAAEELKEIFDFTKKLQEYLLHIDFVKKYLIQLDNLKHNQILDKLNVH